MRVSRDLKVIDKEINTLHHTLLNQLKKSHIVYIDLSFYVREIERLKMERDCVIMERMMGDGD